MAGKKTKHATDVVDEILIHLQSDKRRLTWLSEITQIPYSTLYFIFIRRERILKQGKLDKINEALGTNFKL